MMVQLAGTVCSVCVLLLHIQDCMHGRTLVLNTNVRDVLSSRSRMWSGDGLSSVEKYCLRRTIVLTSQTIGFEI